MSKPRLDKTMMKPPQMAVLSFLEVSSEMFGNDSNGSNAALTFEKVLIRYTAS